MENIKNYRAVASLCRQQAVLHPEASWHWLAEAERYEDLAEAEIEAHLWNAMAASNSISRQLDVSLPASFPHPA